MMIPRVAAAREPHRAFAPQMRRFPPLRSPGNRLVLLARHVLSVHLKKLLLLRCLGTIQCTDAATALVCPLVGE